jgi:formylglycine-generating enzyme
VRLEEKNMKNRGSKSLFVVMLIGLCSSLVVGCGAPDPKPKPKLKLKPGSVTVPDVAGVDETILLPSDVPLEMVWIEPGTFMMGSPSGEQDRVWDETQHSVTLTQGFWMGKYELTKAQWTAVMGTTPWSGQDFVLEDGNSPAEYVSWNDAQAFITALNTLTNKTFRLPTEAEREYACRAGTTERFYWGDALDSSAIGSYAWFYDNARDAGQRYAHVVGQKTANAWDLYDMSGNVYEWCNDWYDTSYYSSSPASDPVGPTSGSRRVLRGGSWSGYGGDCRSAIRCSGAPSGATDGIGFRLSR